MIADELSQILQWSHLGISSQNVTVRATCCLPFINGEDGRQHVGQQVCYRSPIWLGHIAQMSTGKQPLKVLCSQTSGPGVRGRPRESWRSFVQTDSAEHLSCYVCAYVTRVRQLSVSYSLTAQILNILLRHTAAPPQLRRISQLSRGSFMRLTFRNISNLRLY